MKDFLKDIGIGAIYASFMLLGFGMVVLAINLFIANLGIYTRFQNFLLGFMAFIGCIIFWKAVNIE